MASNSLNTYRGGNTLTTLNFTSEQLFYIFIGTAIFSLLFILLLIVLLMRKKSTKKEKFKKGEQETPGHNLIRELTALEGPLTNQLKAKLSEAETDALGTVLINTHLYSRLVQSELVKALIAFDALPRFVQKLQDANYKTRVQAAEVLGKLGSPQAIQPLLMALQDRNDEVRLEVARSLGMLKGEQAVRPLIEALKEPDKFVPARVAEVLISLGSLTVPALVDEILSSGIDKQTCSFICEILGEIKDPRSVEALVFLLQDNYPEVRAKAAEALGSIRNSEAVAGLTGALADTVWTVQIQAAKALGAIADKEAIPALAVALEDSQYGVRISAAEALAKIGGAGLAILNRVAQIKDHPMAERAAILLKGRV